MSLLDKIGLKHKTDKASDGHNYLSFYENFLPPVSEPVLLVEAGIGGYKYPERGGESLRMWQEYYPCAHSICGFDLYDKSQVSIPGVLILQIDQTDKETLDRYFIDGTIDVFIDDASHINPLSIRTFEIMFPKVAPGGVYIWEDIHTSYWIDEYHGNPIPGTPGTAAHFITELMHGLQADTLTEENRGPWAGHIESIHLMRNTAVIIKRK